jgi:hypothetical protein
VKLTLIVDADGKVVSLTLQEGPGDAYSQAVAEAKEWKYTPFEKEGRNVVAKITDYVRILPPEGTQSPAGVDFARQLEPEGEGVKFLLSVESAKAGRP